jgi:hypothetical protein
MVIVGLTNVRRLDLGNLERAKSDESSELENHIVAIVYGGPPKLVEIVVGHPDLVRVRSVGRLEAHDGYYSYRHIISSV